MFNSQGQLFDSVYYGCMTSRGGAVRHLGDTSAAAKTDETSRLDEQINVHMDDVDPRAHAIVFVITSSSGVGAYDLGTPSRLFMEVKAKGAGEKDKPATVARGEFGQSKRPSGTGSLISAMLYRAPGGWNLKSLMAPVYNASWSEIIPDIKTELLSIIPSIKIDYSERVTLLGKSADTPLDTLANMNLAPPTEGAEPPPKKTVTTVRLDLGWVIAEDAAADSAAMSIEILLCDKTGEVVATVNAGAKEAAGVLLGAPEPVEVSKGGGAG